MKITVEQIQNAAETLAKELNLAFKLYTPEEAQSEDGMYNIELEATDYRLLVFSNVLTGEVTYMTLKEGEPARLLEVQDLSSDSIKTIIKSI